MMSAKTKDSVRYSITEAAEKLDRSPHTLRTWDRNGSMPARLRPKRDEHGHRYWTPELIEQIKKWIADNHFHPGRGIAYNPTPEQLEAHINKIRAASKPHPHFNGKQGALKQQITEAIEILGIAPDKIIAELPKVAKTAGVDLSDALTIAAEVIEQH